MGFCFYGETVCFEFYLNICQAALQNYAVNQPIHRFKLLKANNI
mgnify:FL=1